MMWALRGAVSQEILTYRARPLVHDNRSELEYLFPGASVRVVGVTSADLRAVSPLEPMSIRDHPDMQAVRWPLDPKDFR